MKAILKQDVGWFDEHPTGQLPTAVTTNMAKVQDGLGRKIGDIVSNGLGGALKFRLYVVRRLGPFTLPMFLFDRLYLHQHGQGARHLWLKTRKTKAIHGGFVGAPHATVPVAFHQTRHGL